MNEDDIVQDDLSEEGLGDIIKEQDRKLKERYDEINYRNNRLRQSQQRQRALDNRGLTDDQIREKIKEQDAQRAKENLPSQSPQEKRKQQRDMEEGDYLQDPEINSFNQNLRFGAGLLVEIFGNVGLDALQVASGLTGPAGIAATTSIQGSGSAFFNYLNQKIRGEKTINKGEMAAASAASLIPGLQPFKAATRAGRFYKGVLRGSTAGVIDVTGTRLGKGEEVTPTDLTMGAITGGTFGSIYGIKDGGEAFKALKNKVNLGKALVGFDELPITPDGRIGIVQEDLAPQTFAASTENPIEKFGKKLGKQVQKAVEDTKQGVQRVLGRKPDNIEVEPGFEAFALDPSSKEAQRVLLDAIARKSGYKGLADFKKNVINKYPDPQAQEELIYKFSKEGYGVGQIEHKTAKSSKKARKAKIERQNPDASAAEINSILADRSKNTYDMDWYWDTEYIGRDGKLYTDGLGKGDRDGIFNTEITFDARRISLKNVVEGIGYGGEGKGGKALAGRAGALVEREGLPPGILVQSPNPADRIIVTIENTGSRKNIINRVGQLGNIRLRRAGDNRLLGEIGDYVDALYPKTEEARELLNKGLEAKGITDVSAWRRDQIYKRLKAIVDGQTTLPKTKDVRIKRINARLEKDMQELFEEFPFLRPQEQVFDEVTTGIDVDQATRGQRSGPFLSKTEERQIQQSKIRRAPLPVPKEEIITQQEFDFD
tara:strand:+ start:99 stop:2237 length:2139 start_codon:yes stop_codon:yes gene_type:complete